MKIRPVGTELFHVDGRTDMTKQIAATLRTRLNIEKHPEDCNIAVHT